jgi:hypothetical protein
MYTQRRHRTNIIVRGAHVPEDVNPRQKLSPTVSGRSPPKIDSENWLLESVKKLKPNALYSCSLLQLGTVSKLLFRCCSTFVSNARNYSSCRFIILQQKPNRKADSSTVFCTSVTRLLRTRTTWTQVHVHPIWKIPKNAISKFQKNLKKCTHVHIMLTLTCADFGIKNDHV